ncbi:hypothethical protein (plasmid) [Ralstonia solanacearum CMR15]|nr:hypothethical protein [Ralstonia solanacearum CMR15]
MRIVSLFEVSSPFLSSFRRPETVTAPSFPADGAGADGVEAAASRGGSGWLIGSGGCAALVLAFGDVGCALTWGRLPLPMVGRLARAWGGEATRVSFGVDGGEPADSGAMSNGNAYEAAFALICIFPII